MPWSISILSRELYTPVSVETMIHVDCTVTITDALSSSDIHYDNILIQPTVDEIPSIVEKFLAGIEQNALEKPILFPLTKADKTYITLIDFDTG